MDDPQVVVAPNVGCLLMPFVLMAMFAYYVFRMVVVLCVVFAAFIAAMGETAYETYRVWREYHGDR